MVFRKSGRISRPVIVSLIILLLFTLAGMKHGQRFVVAAQSTHVDIDILPGASKFIDTSRPFIPVVIFGSENLNVANIDPVSIRLAGAPTTKKKNGQLRVRYRDVNGDGRIDLVAYVSVYSLNLDEGTSEALLTAATFDGRSVSGTQQVSFRRPAVQWNSRPLTVEDVAGSFSNPGLIKILDTDPKPTPAKPYPSSISVTGQPSIARLTVSIFGFWHTFPDDVDILLVGPTGAMCLLMADCGGGNFITSNNPVNLTFADGSPSLPDNDQIVSGTYRPTRGTCFGGGDNCAPGCGDPTRCADNFPSPAPLAPYPTSLAAFNGTNPNGTWSLYVIDDSAGDDGQILSGWSLNINPSANKARFDFDGDKKSDIGVYRPSNGFWLVINSASGQAGSQQWGLSGDVPVPADYDGDGKTDIAVFRPSNGTWFIIQSSNGQARIQQWGLSGDLPVPADYDGDGKADIAVFRPSNSTWYVMQSSNGNVGVQQWGLSGDKPVPADYDGDGKADIAVYRPSNGFWIVINSSTGQAGIQQWGLSGDTPVPADYDGDGKADIAVFRPSNGTWYIIQSSIGGSRVQQWGLSGDTPVPADYDGDGKADIAVFRPSNSTWYVIQSLTGNLGIQQWGLSGDVPLPSVYIR